jgi:serine/threonine protein kinase
MDPFTAGGLALGIVSLSFQVFAGCVKGFMILSSAHNFGKDASFLKTMLSVEEYRFVQWADVVGLTGADSRILRQLNQTLAEQLMEQLRDKLDSTKLKERYSLDLQEDETSSDRADSSIGEQSHAPSMLSRAVSNKRRSEILLRAQLIQSRTPFPKRLRWAAIDKSRFQDLVLDLRQIVDSLWNLLEPIRLRELSQQVARTLTTVVDMSQDLEALKGLRATFTKQTADFPGDTILSTAVDLKVLRKGLSREGSSDSTSDSSLAQRPLYPLNRNLFIRAAATRGADGIFMAQYDGRPVLCESKPVDPWHKPKLKVRAEHLTRLLSLPKSASFMTLQCLGFLEDIDEFKFVYDYPPGSDTTVPPRSLLDLLRDPTMQNPSVTTRLRLALSICKTLLTIHTAGWFHKNIRSENIIFINREPDLGKPYLTGFSFARTDSPVEISDQRSADPLLDIYRHPHVLRKPPEPYSIYMDHYSLATVLTEIAEWRPLKHIVSKHIDVTNTDLDIPLSALAGIQPWLIRAFTENGQVAYRMGEVYANGVSSLLRLELADERNYSSTEQLLAYQKFVNELDLCYV